MTSPLDFWSHDDFIYKIFLIFVSLSQFFVLCFFLMSSSQDEKVNFNPDSVPRIKVKIRTEQKSPARNSRCDDQTCQNPLMKLKINFATSLPHVTPSVCEMSSVFCCFFFHMFFLCSFSSCRNLTIKSLNQCKSKS